MFWARRFLLWACVRFLWLSNSGRMKGRGGDFVPARDRVLVVPASTHLLLVIIIITYKNGRR